MKKAIAVLLALTFLFSFPITAEARCMHPVTYQQTQPPTCADVGRTFNICSYCGATVSFTVTASALGHQYNTTGTTAMNICIRNTTCGYINGATSSHFQHYMYRTTSLTGSTSDRRANYIYREHPTPGFNYPNTSGSINGGIDIQTGSVGVVMGYHIYAQGTGVVSNYGINLNTPEGNFVEITYTNGWRVQYMHFIDPPSVGKDEPVSVSTQIGRTGMSGTTSTGYHLHIDVKQNGNFVRTRNLFPNGTMRN
ncbi:MAG: peptidoglycan DD-metalloendopeptidase family protein [Oscillospiraceae bacterium]|jgi:murein DD-endopeptidase MepM/ murein hydrolase activator NlpD|nr:peptidoglycan DD-metalloendopeptidase family protein [Oscillospiraceae bacterium]